MKHHSNLCLSISTTIVLSIKFTSHYKIIVLVNSSIDNESLFYNQ